MNIIPTFYKEINEILLKNKGNTNVIPTPTRTFNTMNDSQNYIIITCHSQFIF